MPTRKAPIKIDVAIIGAGTAGLRAFYAAEKKRKRAVLFHEGPLGTTCARVGCMPSKLLIAAADRAHDVKHADLFGLKTSLDVRSVKVFRRVREERDRFVAFVLKDMKQLYKKKKLFCGTVRFLNEHTLQVGKSIFRTKTIVFATGTRARIPEPYLVCKENLLTNETLFEINKLPKSLLVVGGGLIGLELGQAFQRLGVRVCILGHKHAVGPISDPVVAKQTEKIFLKELDFHSHHEIINIKSQKNKVNINFKGRSQKKYSGIFERVLIAAGRVPNLDPSEMHHFGIPLDRQGFFKVNAKTLRIADSHIYLAGDVTGDRQVLHEAAREGEIAGTNAATYPYTKEFVRNVRLTIAFTNPQMALVGESWISLHKAKRSFIVGEVNFKDQGRARILGVNSGLLRLYAEPRRGRLLGAEMAGPAMEHLAHLLAWSIEEKFTAEKLLEKPYYHPVIEEGLRTALKEIKKKVILRRK